MHTASNIEYKINHLDEIVFINKAWNGFALENDASELTDGKILDRSLWDFITDETTLQLYKDILNLVRAGDVMRFNFQCDSPDKVRFMEMIISPEENNGVLFQTRTLSVDECLSQRILDRNVARTNRLIIICGWCKAIDTGSSGNKDWKDLAIGISILDLFKQYRLPELSHGMCDTCYSAISENLSQRNKKINFECC